MKHRAYLPSSLDMMYFSLNSSGSAWRSDKRPQSLKINAVWNRTMYVRHNKLGHKAIKYTTYASTETRVLKVNAAHTLSTA